MDIVEAVSFARRNGRAVLATVRRDGRPQLSPVIVVVDDDDRLLVSTRATAMKAHNIEREPWASVCLLSEGFFDGWAQIEGPAEVLRLPEAMEPLVDYYRRAAGEHEDWNDYRAAMEREQRVLLRITPRRAGPSVSG